MAAVVYVIISLLTLVIFAVRSVIKNKTKLVNHAQFAWLMNLIITHCHKMFEQRKRQLFAPLKSLRSGSRENLRLLEIGVGTGTNLSFYPEGTELICVDLNPKFQPYFEATMKKHPHVRGKAFHVCSAEDLLLTAVWMQ